MPDLVRVQQETEGPRTRYFESLIRERFMNMWVEFRKQMQVQYLALVIVERP